MADDAKGPSRQGGKLTPVSTSEDIVFQESDRSTSCGTAKGPSQEAVELPRHGLICICQERRALRDRDFEWWQALCLVDAVPMEPWAVKRFMLQLHEDELRAERERALRALKAKVIAEYEREVTSGHTEPYRAGYEHAAEIVARALSESGAPPESKP